MTMASLTDLIEELGLIADLFNEKYAELALAVGLPTPQNGNSDSALAPKSSTATRRKRRRKVADPSRYPNDGEPWTAQQRRDLIEARQRGVSIEELSIRLGRTPSAVRNRLGHTKSGIAPSLAKELVR